MALFWNNYKQGQQPYEVVTIHTATFDESLPDRFTPADIGVEVGTSVSVNFPNDLGDRGITWDGGKLVARPELTRRIRAGELEWGPGRRLYINDVKMVNEAKSRAGVKSPKETEENAAKYLGVRYVDNTPGLWEKYVVLFVAKYKLNSEQAQIAFTILRHCRQQADNYLTRHADEARKLDSAEKNVRKRLVGQEYGAVTLTDVLKRKARLERPIVRIFEDQLVPGLKKLPTRAQRKAGDAVPPPSEEKRKVKP